MHRSCQLINAKTNILYTDHVFKVGLLYFGRLKPPFAFFLSLPFASGCYKTKPNIFDIFKV